MNTPLTDDITKNHLQGHRWGPLQIPPCLKLLFCFFSLVVPCSTEHCFTPHPLTCFPSLEVGRHPLFFTPCEQVKYHFAYPAHRWVFLIAPPPTQHSSEDYKIHHLEKGSHYSQAGIVVCWLCLHLHLNFKPHYERGGTETEKYHLHNMWAKNTIKQKNTDATMIYAGSRLVTIRATTHESLGFNH